MLIDEAGFYLLPGVVKTYAPRGQTPVLQAPCSRDHWSVMSGITPGGKLYTLARPHPLTSVESVHFLCHIGRPIGGKLLPIGDGSPIHRGGLVKEFLQAGGAGFVHLEHFPPYAPDLNPDELVWQHLKHVELKNLCCLDLHHLSVELNLAINRLRKKSSLIQSFFAGAGLDL